MFEDKSLPATAKHLLYDTTSISFSSVQALSGVKALEN